MAAGDSRKAAVNDLPSHNGDRGQHGAIRRD